MNNPASQQQRDPITHRFIGHAMKVHSLIGPGLSEEIYHQELVASLQNDGIEHLSKPKRDLVYRGYIADTFEPDLVVESHFIPELKSLQGKFSPAHMVQAFCYCKFWRLRTSLLVDFGKQSLTWERLLYTSHTALLPEPNIPTFVSNIPLATKIVQAVRECLSEIGLGYRQITWKGLVIVHGATDEIGMYAVDKPVHVRDFHATILHLMGLDHEKLTYRHAGLDFRLTGVEHITVVKEILA